MSPRDRTILAAVLLVVVALGGWFLLVKPKQKQASQLQSQITSAQQSLNAAEAEVQNAAADEAKYKSYVRQLKSLRAAVPSDPQIPELINELQAAANKTKTSFQMVSLSSSSTSTTSTPTTTTTGAGSSQFPSQSFSLQFNGTYFTVANLLGRMTRFVIADNRRFKATGRLLNVGSVTFAAGPKGFPSVSATVNAVDYDVPVALVPGAGGAGASTGVTSG